MLQGGLPYEEALALALRDAAEGWHVGPVQPSGQPVIPRTSGFGGRGHNDFSNDLEVVTKLFEKARNYSELLNVARHPGPSGYFVADLDVKDGKQGPERWIEQGGKKTFTVETPSGGLHLYYPQPDRPVGTKNNWVPGVDIKGWGGYVLSPGSRKLTKNEQNEDVVKAYVTLGGTYTQPESSLSDRLPRRRSDRDAIPLDVELLTPLDKQLLEYLIEKGWTPVGEMIKGCRWDDVGEWFTWEEDGEVVDLHRDEAYYVQLTHPTHKNSGSCASLGQVAPGHVMMFTTSWDLGPKGELVPAMQAPDLEQLKLFEETGSFYPNIRLDSGPDLVKIDTGNKTLRDRLFTSKQLQKLPPPKWLVKGILQQKSINFLTADPNVGKTYLALDWAYHIVTGNDWMGHEVEQGKVLYIAAEGGGRPLGDRLQAWEEYHEYEEGSEDLIVVDGAVDLCNAEEILELIEFMKEFSPDFVVIDTYSMSTPTADTDSGGKDAKIVLKNLGTILDASKACILAIDHPGKSSLSKDTIRGSVTQQGRVDLHMYLDGSAGDPSIVLQCKKTRSVGHFNPIPLKRHTIELSTGGTQCVITEGDFLNEVLGLGPKLSPSEQIAFDALKELGTITGGVSNKAWLEECGRKKPQWVNNPTSFTKARDSLIEKGLVWKTGDRAQARYGIKEL